jgi:Ribonuclease G/E
VTTRVLAVASPGEVQALAERDGTLLDYAIWRPGRPDGVGDLHRGRVQARVPQMAGAFVLIEEGTGFLPDSEGGADATEGEAVGVRVTRAAQGGKGPRLTARLAPEEVRLVGTGPAPALLRHGPGAVERLAALYPDAAVLADDPALVALLRPRLGERIAPGRDLLDEGLAAQTEALAGPEATLPGGLRASFHPTPALVAVDVDTAGGTAGRQNKAAALAELNRAALPALAVQIRLRNLSGAILVDLAGLSPKRRAALGPALAAALATDPLRPRLLGFTGLGFAEIVRPRVHPPLHEVLAGPHAAGLAALRAVEREGAARLRAAPDVAAALEADAAARADLARRTGRPLILWVDPALPACSWALET